MVDKELEAARERISVLKQDLFDAIRTNTVLEDVIAAANENSKNAVDCITNLTNEVAELQKEKSELRKVIDPMIKRLVDHAVNLKNFTELNFN